MPIPTELVGSLPRPMKLQEAYADYDEGKITFEQLQSPRTPRPRTRSSAWRQTGEPIVTDGEQRESSFATYNLTDTLAGTGLADGLAGDGQFFAIFDDGHHRQLPADHRRARFATRPTRRSSSTKNRAIATHPVKQAVISPSMMMLLYPLEGEIDGLLARRSSSTDCVNEAEKDIRQCFDAGAVRVSVDFTEGRLANKNDSPQPLDRQEHAAGVHRPQQPAVRPLQRRRSGPTSGSTPARAATATRCTPRRSPTSCCWSTCSR